jgi:hypothetical protein
MEIDGNEEGSTVVGTEAQVTDALLMLIVPTMNIDLLAVILIYSVTQSLNCRLQAG